MKIIDAHTHIFPQKIAQKASDSIGAFYNKDIIGNGLSEQLRKNGTEIANDRALEKTGQTFEVAHYVVHSVATVPRQVESINTFIRNEMQEHPEYIGFATVHPFMENLEQTVEEIIESGQYYGIKLHPDFQEFYIDGAEAQVIYKRVQGRLPIHMHMGDEFKEFSKPERLARMIDKYPDLTFIAAHFGGYKAWDDSEKYLIGHDAYMDTSSSLTYLEPERAVQMIRKQGADKFLFGTDYPMWSLESELLLFMNLPLTEEEREKILFTNAAKLFGIM